MTVREESSVSTGVDNAFQEVENLRPSWMTPKDEEMMKLSKTAGINVRAGGQIGLQHPSFDNFRAKRLCFGQKHLG